MADWAATVLPRLAAMGLDKRLPLLVSLLMTLLVAQGLAVLTWELLPRPELEAIPVTAVNERGAVAANTAQQRQLQQISGWHLFGEVQKVAPKPIAQVTEAPDTRLNLKLSGVLASSEPRSARAIIADGRGTEKAYGVDDTLPGNAILREIYADRVILEHRGRLETLRLPKEKLPGGTSSAVTTRSGNTRGAAAPSSGLNSATAEPAALLRQYREALVSDPQSLMNLVAAAPVTDRVTGRLKGYRIRPGKDKQLLGRFGLMSGDVVTSVNGVALDNPIKGLEIMRDLTTASSVTLEVERKGSMQSFSFQVD
jgi:general secretion pathway protein C